MYQSEMHVDAKILFSIIIHLLDPEIWKMLVRDLCGNENSTFDSGP